VVYHYLQLLLSPVQILPMHQAPCPRLDTYSAARSTPTDRNLTVLARSLGVCCLACRMCCVGCPARLLRDRAVTVRHPTG
jgi:hypothetical protein